MSNQHRKIARHPLDALPHDTPVTVGMLLDAIHTSNQAVGFVLSAAMQTAGVNAQQRKLIAQQLHTASAQDVFFGPAGEAISGITFGILAHIQGTPEKVGTSC